MKKSSKAAKKETKAAEKKEQTLDDIISEQQDEMDKNSENDDSEPSGFIGRHMKKIADKQKAIDDEKKERQMEKEMEKAQAEGFIVQSNIKNGVKEYKKLAKNKKRGILARAEEKINASQAEQEKQKEEDLT